MRKIAAILFLMFLCRSAVHAQEVWVNDLRTQFLSSKAVIYEINLRTFAAQDINKNGIIDFNEKEESGNFLNAISRLDELKSQGINTLHVMPITPVGKVKALGTAGSLYAAAGFNSLNPQLKSEKSMLPLDAQARKFFDEAHKRGFRVIVDLPSCGSYDLYLKRPELFVRDKSEQAVVPSDWTDVRLLNAGSENNINREVYNLYKGFVDYMLNLGADGIRADVAASKPASFWKELIAYSRKKDPQFLWLAEASESWHEPVTAGAVFTPYNKLLEAGFDGYYGSYFNLKEWKTGKKFIEQINETRNALKKFDTQKSVIGSFTTHDEVSPVVVNGAAFSEMIIWLNATLPVNSYFVDGFSTGDSYIYLWANKKARKTYTDDEYYFVHRGKLDIFNFSRQPGGRNTELLNEFIRANSFKEHITEMLNMGNFIPLKAGNSSVFAYALSYEDVSIIVYGNLNWRTPVETAVYVPKISQDSSVMPIKIIAVPTAGSGKFKVKLQPGEIQVLMVSGLTLK